MFRGPSEVGVEDAVSEFNGVLTESTLFFFPFHSRKH